MGETQNTVTRRAGIVGLWTLASRVLGLVRESVLAAFFPTEVIDAFQVAFMIPNSFRRLTAEGAFSPAVISVFSKTWTTGDLEASQRFVRAVLGFSLVFLLALAVFGTIWAEEITRVVGGGFVEHPEKFTLAVKLTQLMFPYIMLVSIVALAMGLLNSTGRFFAPAFAPVLLNASIIGSAVGLAGSMPSLGLNPIFALAFGVLVGGVAQVLLQLPSLAAVKLLVRPSLDFRHPGLVQVIRLTGPMVLGAVAYQVSLFISVHLASTLGHGAVTYIQFSTRLTELPLAVLVMAISTAALPSLAALRGQGRMDEFKATYSHSLRLALFVTTPAMVALIVLAEPVVAILYQRGLFTHAGTLETARALRWMAAGICSVALLRQTVPVFYALEQVWVPAFGTLIYILAYVVSALPLMEPFKHAGLCMAISIGATAQALFLVAVLRRRIGRVGFGKTIVSWLRFLLASAPMAAGIFALSNLGAWEEGGNSLRNIGVLALTVLAGVVIYGVASYILRVPELTKLVDAIKQRRRRAGQ